MELDRIKNNVFCAFFKFELNMLKNLFDKSTSFLLLAVNIRARLWDKIIKTTQRLETLKEANKKKEILRVWAMKL